MGIAYHGHLLSEDERAQINQLAMSDDLWYSKTQVQVLVRGMVCVASWFQRGEVLGWAASKL